MLVEPSDKNFQKFKKENPFLTWTSIWLPRTRKKHQSNLSMSSNCSTKVINILYHKNDEGQSHYVFIKNMNLLLHSVTKPSHKVFVCSLTVHAHTSTHKKTYLGHLEKSIPTLTTNSCVRSTSTLYILKRLCRSTKWSAWWKSVSCNLWNTCFDWLIHWEECNNYMFNRIPTCLVADFESILLKEEQAKWSEHEDLHKHQPCAWG